MAPRPRPRGVRRAKAFSLLAAVLVSDARLRVLSGDVALPVALQALYLRLLTNADFKDAFATAYATHYTHIADAYLKATAEGGLVFASQISVRCTPPQRASERASGALATVRANQPRTPSALLCLRLCRRRFSFSIVLESCCRSSKIPALPFSQGCWSSCAHSCVTYRICRSLPTRQYSGQSGMQDDEAFRGTQICSARAPF
jgi:hypothetical protein